MTVRGRRGAYAESVILAEWPAIVGADLARLCRPVRFVAGPRSVRYGTLTVQASGDDVPKVQRAARLLLEQVQDYFGYRLASYLQVRQMPAEAAPAVVKVRPKRRHVLVGEGLDRELASRLDAWRARP